MGGDVMDLTGIGAVFDFGSKVIDKLFPDKTEAERLKLELLRQQQAGEFKELEARYSAIVAEAQSADPWTSRARPSFMYVMYLMILASIPMGFLFAFRPDVAMAVTAGVKNWLAALPEEMWWLFGAGYLGYSGARMFEKVKR
jgi:hypothetical protein